MKATSSSRPPFRFLNTPLEIRREIYRYCLLRRDPVCIHHPFSYRHPFSDRGTREYKISLLLVSRQVGSEALVVLYGENIFKVCLSDGGEADLKKLFAKANIGRVRRMEILTPSTFGYLPFDIINYSYKPDSRLWSPFFSNLTKLSIVVRQPLQIRAHYKEPKMKKGLEWLRVNLQEITSHLSRSCIVEVDDDDRKQTRAVMDESFLGDYRKVQTLSGDAYFGRNDYWFFDEQSESSEKDDHDGDQDDDDDNDNDNDNDNDDENDDDDDDNGEENDDYDGPEDDDNVDFNASQFFLLKRH